MSRPLTLAFDLDGVLADYTAAMRSAGNISPDAPAPRTYGLHGPENPGWFADESEWYAAHCQVTANLANMELEDPGAPETLRDLQAEGHQIVYLTARSPCTGVDAGMIHRDTTTWLREAGFPAADSLVTDPDKARHYTDHGFDALIDDAPHNVEDVIAAGGHVTVRDQSYNRHLPGVRAYNAHDYAEHTAGSEQFRRAAAQRRALRPDDRLRANRTHLYRTLDGDTWSTRPRSGGDWSPAAALPPSAQRVTSAHVAQALGGRCVACGRELADASRFGGYGPECVKKYA